MAISDLGESEKVVSTPWRRVRPLWRTVALVVATFGLYFFYWFGATWDELKQETGKKGMHPWGHFFSLFVPIYQLFQIYAHFRLIKEVIVQRSGAKSVTPALLPPGVALVLFLLSGFLFRLSAYLSALWAYTGFPWWHGSGLLVLGTLLGVFAFPGGPPQGALNFGCCYSINTEEYYVELPFYISLGPGLSFVVFLISIGVLISLIASTQQVLNSLWQSSLGTVSSNTRWYHWVVLVLGAFIWFLVFSILYM